MYGASFGHGLLVGGDGNANDIIGANHGTLVNGATFAPGMVGQAFSLDGTNDYVDVGDVDLPATFTIDTWIRPNNVTAYQTIVSKDNNDTLRSYFFQLEATGTLVGSVRNSISQYTQYRTSSAVVSAGSWQHVAMVYDGSAGAGQKMRFYVNGVSYPAAVIASQDSGGTPEDNALSTKLGIIGDVVTSPFNGLIDEVEIFDRALTAEEIAAIANAGSAGKCRSCVAPPSGMVSWWDGEGDANDIIGTNDGTLVNGATFAPGKVSQAFSFDGTDDYVSLADSSTLDFNTNSPMSVDLWIYRTRDYNRQTLLGKQSGCTANGMNYTLALDELAPLNGVCFIGNDVNNHKVCINGAANDILPLNQWIHIAVTFDGSSMRIYRNGLLVNTANSVQLGPPNDEVFSIGKSGDCQTYGLAFGGRIDEVEIFNRALSTEEIAAIANAGSAGKCQATDDTTPDPFTFVDVTGVPLSTVQTSNAITVNGITAPAPLSIVGGEYELGSNPGTWSSSDGTVANGDTVRVRHTSAATASTAVDTTLTIGGVFDTFTSTTLGPDLTGAWNPVTQRCRRGRCTLLGSVRVWNQGTATALRSRLRVILSDDAVLDPGDTMLQESSIGRLRPGQSQTRWVNVRLPLGVNALGKYLFAVIDVLNSVTETDETNNEPMYGPIP